jgi:3',5'-cyclic AMP phosphodiesterase CpdA
MARTDDFAVLADLHFMPEGRLLYGIDPRGRLDAALALLARDHAGIGCLVLLGDLAHRGEAESYRALAQALAGAGMPIVPMMGNHDRRRAFLDEYPNDRPRQDGFVQSAVELERCTLIALDTLDEERGDAGGRLCPERRQFLRDALRDARPDKPVYCFLHHPPFATGSPAYDAIALDEPEALLRIFDAAGRRPDHILCGHVHQTINGAWHGIPVSTQRSLVHQLGQEGQADAIEGTLEQPTIAIGTVTPDGLRLRHRNLLYEGPVFLPKGTSEIVLRP